MSEDDVDCGDDIIQKYYLTSKGKTVVEEIVAMYKQGDTIASIANQLGVTIEFVRIMMAVDANIMPST